MDQDVELAPALGDLLEHRFELARLGDVRAAPVIGASSAVGQRLDMGTRPFRSSQVTARSAPASRKALAQP